MQKVNKKESKKYPNRIKVEVKIVFIVLIALIIILSISLVAVLLSIDKGTSDVRTNNKGKDNIFTKNDVKITKTVESELKLEDYSNYMVYDIMAITANKDNFINYVDILSESINSIEFTDSYVKKTIDDGNNQTKQALAINAQMQQAYDSYNQAWENRQKSMSKLFNVEVNTIKEAGKSNDEAARCFTTILFDF